MKRKIVGHIIECSGFALTCFCFVRMAYASLQGLTDTVSAKDILLLLGLLGGILIMPVGESLSLDGRYSYTPHIFLLKSPDKTSTKRLQLNLEMPMEEEEKVAECIISPLKEAWRWTQDKKSKFHKEYLSMYYSLTPCLEEIAKALSEWSKQYLECTSEEERKQMKNELKQALSKKGPLRNIKHHVMIQMNAIKIKEEQYQKDVRAAEKSLADMAPVLKTPVPERNIFAETEIFASSLNEMDALIHKYAEPKKKGKKKNIYEYRGNYCLDKK